MPSFSPRSPRTLDTCEAMCLSSSVVRCRPLLSGALLIEAVVGLELDLDVDAGRQVEPHERVNRLGRRVENVDEPLVGAHLEVLARVLVLVRRADDAVDVLLGRQWNRADDTGARARHRLNDLARAGVDGLVVVGLEPNADLLSRHGG